MALDRVGVSAERFAEVARLIDQNKIAASAAGALFDRLMELDSPAEQVASELGLMQVSDGGAVDAAIEAVIAQNPRAVQDFRSGKQAAMNMLVGMVMKGAKGLNPQMVQERLRAKLNG